MEVRAVE